MHRILGVGIVLGIAAYTLHGMGTITKSEYQIPEAIKHDAPIFFEYVKERLPSKDEIRAVAEDKVMPVIKDSAQELNSTIRNR
jgi:hypothetical protein